MMRTAALSTLFSGLVLLMCVGCEYKKEVLVYPRVAQCDTLSMSYRNHIAPLMDQYCNNCHGGMSLIEKGGGIGLITYEEVNMFAEAGILLDNILWVPGSNPMPKNGIKMPDCAINQIRAWINQGRKDN